MRVLSHELLETGASRRQWFSDEADTTDLKCIEDDENGRLLPGGTAYMFSRNRQPRLQTTEIDVTVLVGDNNFAVDECVGPEYLARL
jgi:hypothetical protein